MLTWIQFVTTSPPKTRARVKSDIDEINDDVDDDDDDDDDDNDDNDDDANDDDDDSNGGLFPQAECVSLFAHLQISIKMLSGQTIKSL